MMRVSIMCGVIFALMLTGCGSGNGAVAPLPAPARATVPVAVGCVSGDRPDAVAPLSATHGHQEWTALSAQQKAALVAAQGLRHQNRSDALDAATGACL